MEFNKETILQNESEKEREQILLNNADVVREGVRFNRLFTEDDIESARKQLAETLDQLDDTEEEFKNVKKEYKERLDALKAKRKELSLSIRQRGTMIEGTLYDFRDFESSRVFSYDVRGVLIDSRRLRPDEKQRTIMGARRNATNGELEGDQL